MKCEKEDNCNLFQGTILAFTRMDRKTIKRLRLLSNAGEFQTWYVSDKSPDHYCYTFLFICTNELTNNKTPDFIPGSILFCGALQNAHALTWNHCHLCDSKFTYLPSSSFPLEHSASTTLTIVEVSIEVTYFYRDRVASPVLQPPTFKFL